MGSGRFLLFWGAVFGLGLAWLLTLSASDTFHTLKDAEIRARLAGMEITDGVHWAEQYLRDGTYRAFHMA